MSDPTSWVVGRGGMLGQSLQAELARRGTVWWPAGQLSWGDSRALAVQFAEACRSFRDRVGRSPWQVAWCAGAGVVGSGHVELEAEVEALSFLLHSLAGALGPARMANGAVFVASSAGGIYAGSTGAPFSESSAVRPISPYGDCKRRQEELVCRWSRETGTPALIGRLSNLYGPGQKLNKDQGLITQMCARALTRQPLMLYVPLDTIRDYIFAADAAGLVADGLRLLRATAREAPEAPIVLKIIASQQPSTVASILGKVRHVTKRPISVVVSGSPHTHRQVHDLRMTSTVWPELDQRPLTTLDAGVHAVLTELRAKAGEGRLTSVNRPGP